MSASEVTIPAMTPAAAGPPPGASGAGPSQDTPEQLLASPGAIPARRGPRPRLAGERLEEVVCRRQDGASIRAIEAAIGTPRSTISRALNRAGVDRPTSTSARTPRQALYRLIRLGRIPDASTLACADCRRRRTAGQPRHEWAMTAKPAGGWKIAPVCIRCHRRRKRMARAAVYRALVDAARSNMGHNDSHLPGGNNAGHANSLVARATSEGAR